MSVLQRKAAVAGTWQRLAPRLAQSAQQTRRHVTVRAADMPSGPGPNGATIRTVYRTEAAAPVKPGELIRIQIIDVPAGTRFEMPVELETDTAWLVLDGQIDIGGILCNPYDYQVRRKNEPSVSIVAKNSARLMLRESKPSARSPGSAIPVQTTHFGQTAWETLADGISRRVLQPQQGAAAAYIVQLEAGAAAPAHRHGYAEECLVLEGEMYLDDVLLFGGDFQLARAGGQHHEASSESGVLLLVHGDLDLDVIDAGPH